MPSLPQRVATLVAAAAAFAAVAACSGSGDDGHTPAPTGDRAPTSVRTGTASGTTPAAPASSPTAVRATGAPVRIGLISPAALPDIRKTAEAAARYADENVGGIAGHPIRLVECSDGATTGSARGCANRMVAAGVAAVVVTVTDFGQTLAPIITGSGIPYITLGANSTEELTNPRAFSWTSGARGPLTAMAGWAAGKHYRTVTGFVPAAPPGGTRIATTAAAVFKAAHVALDVVELPRGVTPAARPIATALARNPQAAIVLGDAHLCSSVLTALGRRSTRLPTAVGQGCLDPATVRAGRAALAVGSVFTPVDTYSADPDTRLYLAALRTYAPAVSPRGAAVIGWAAMLGLVRSTRGVQGAVTPTAIFAGIKAARDVPLPAGHGVRFTCDAKAAPSLPSACSTAVLAAGFTGGAPSGYHVVR
ncbi:MAG TPA: ABC transporter substrate-binding protein [Jatrophihabitans sp.]|nr:ABC transporter substrate-binding protein [Jatrophihabitans sp.]